MRALLDTNILIHREAAVHPGSVAEISRHEDERVRTAFKAKLASYNLIQNPSPIDPEVARVGRELDVTDNDRLDTLLLNERYTGRVDILLTEDRGIARKAARLGLADKTFTNEASRGFRLRTGGWKTQVMVQRYAHLSPDHIRAAVERLARSNSGSATGTKTGTGT